VSQAPFELHLAAVLGRLQHRKTCRPLCCGNVPPTSTAAAGSSSKYPVPKCKTTISRSSHEAKATLRASCSMMDHSAQFWATKGFSSLVCPCGIWRRKDRRLFNRRSCRDAFPGLQHGTLRVLFHEGRTEGVGQGKLNRPSFPASGPLTCQLVGRAGIRDRKHSMNCHDLSPSRRPITDFLSPDFGFSSGCSKQGRGAVAVGRIYCSVASPILELESSLTSGPEKTLLVPIKGNDTAWIRYPDGKDDGEWTKVRKYPAVSGCPWS
jgi:hypothetical protein